MIYAYMKKIEKGADMVLFVLWLAVVLIAGTVLGTLSAILDLL